MIFSLKPMLGRLASFVIGVYDCPIVMYHRVLPDDTVDRTLDVNTVVTPEMFEANLLFLLKRFSVVPLSDMMMGIRAGKPSCVITFDDGWLDTYEVAFPILKRLGVPATVFLPTAYIGTHRLFWYDRVEQLLRRWDTELSVKALREHCARLLAVHLPEDVHTTAGVFYWMVHSLKVHHPADIEVRLLEAERATFGRSNTDSIKRLLMNWDEVRTMGCDGISFGSHCVNHSILPTLSYEEQRTEIVESRRTLLSQQIHYVDCISFPNGNYDQDSLDLSEKAGYRLFMSASIGPCGTGVSKRLAHRIGMSSTVAQDERLLNYALVKAKCLRRLYRLTPGAS